MLLTCLLGMGRRSDGGSGFKWTQSRLFDCLMLWTLQGEPITFCEEAFVSHRSSVMRQFLQNAIQLQLFKQVLPPVLHGEADSVTIPVGFGGLFSISLDPIVQHLNSCLLASLSLGCWGFLYIERWVGFPTNGLWAQGFFLSERT